MADTERDSGAAVSTMIPDLSLVICTLNEGTAIRSVINEICDALDGIRHEIIVVDDNSSDNTGSEVLDVAKLRPNVRLHVRVGERGLSSAAIKGWDIAHGRYLGVMDGDGQHDPRAIRQMADMIMAGNTDLVCVSRYLGQTETGLSGLRDIGSKVATAATGLVLKVPLSDPMSGCFLMTRDYYQSARPKLTGIGFKILLDIAASAPKKPRFGEVKAALRERQGGQSKLDLRVVADLGALLIEKATGGLLPARFVLFAGVGVTGVVVYAVVLIAFHLLLRGEHQALYRYQYRYDDTISYSMAIWLSMTWNFFINNWLTFRDKRLKGWAILRALLGFYVACSIGAVLSLVLSLFMKEHLHIHWLVAGISAALLSSVWNYWGARMLSWRDKKPAK
ncbi:glycosyltransferase [Asticcacaulis sp. EMRT-3]|uniref:glycosyltransferase n=1 Tax=Asticcacaulis sp. EMRT-3 TaxID=3040349 RepID=UPI0024AEBF98|nr:glycosyltransferase [Asticcacaulis sp. EMRT-3]MDI7774226.1 glycosyltransferase [Asticcacaulis sp. EMRT-3]